MARTPSTMLELGTSAPQFTLQEPASGKLVSLDEFARQPLVVAFICNHCPYVKHIVAKFSAVAGSYQERGISFVAINSNDVHHYPDDSPDKMIEFGREHGFSFPYLYDESQSVAKAYHAACTPDIYLFDAAHQLVYRGQFDDSHARALQDALKLWQTVQGLLRLTVEGEFDPETAPAGLKAALARAAGAVDFAELEATIRARSARTLAIFETPIPPG